MAGNGFGVWSLYTLPQATQLLHRSIQSGSTRVSGSLGLLLASKPDLDLQPVNRLDLDQAGLSLASKPDLDPQSFDRLGQSQTGLAFRAGSRLDLCVVSASKPDPDPQLFNRLDLNRRKCLRHPSQIFDLQPVNRLDLDQTEVCSGSKSRFWAIASSRARPWPGHAFRRCKLRVRRTLRRIQLVIPFG